MGWARVYGPVPQIDRWGPWVVCWLCGQLSSELDQLVMIDRTGPRGFSAMRMIVCADRVACAGRSRRQADVAEDLVELP
jgi:alpha-D-ribose 1-methylphosphonate 5-phosphate C-P lyase